MTEENPKTFTICCNSCGATRKAAASRDLAEKPISMLVYCEYDTHYVELVCACGAKETV